MGLETVQDRAYPNRLKTGVSISFGTLKMGAIPSVNLPPIISCGNCSLCQHDCYALRPYRRHKNTRRAWNQNWSIYQENIGQYFGDIKDFILGRKKPPELFRWHVGGDIPSQNYMEGVGLAADMFPGTRFLCFTKMYFIVENHIDVYGDLPDNLSIVLSAWPGMRMHNPHDLPVAWMQDGSEVRVPDDCLLCTNTCEDCAACWGLRQIGKDVCFDKHR